MVHYKFPKNNIGFKSIWFSPNGDDIQIEIEEDKQGINYIEFCGYYNKIYFEDCAKNIIKEHSLENILSHRGIFNGKEHYYPHSFEFNNYKFPKEVLGFGYITVCNRDEFGYTYQDDTIAFFNRNNAFIVFKKYKDILYINEYLYDNDGTYHIKDGCKMPICHIWQYPYKSQ